MGMPKQQALKMAVWGRNANPSPWQDHPHSRTGDLC